MLLVHCTVNGSNLTWVLGQSRPTDNATRTKKNGTRWLKILLESNVSRLPTGIHPTSQGIALPVLHPDIE